MNIKDRMLRKKIFLWSPPALSSSDRRQLFYTPHVHILLSNCAVCHCSHSERFCGHASGQFFLRWRGGRAAQLRGPGGNAEFGFHHWQLPAERNDSAAGYPDGQVWAPPNPPDGQVNVGL